MQLILYGFKCSICSTCVPSGLLGFHRSSFCLASRDSVVSIISTAFSYQLSRWTLKISALKLVTHWRCSSAFSCSNIPYCYNIWHGSSLTGIARWTKLDTSHNCSCRKLMLEKWDDIGWYNLLDVKDTLSSYKIGIGTISLDWIKKRGIQ